LSYFNSKASNVNLCFSKSASLQLKATFTDVRNMMRNFTTFSLACLFILPFVYLQFIMHYSLSNLWWWRIEPKNSAAFRSFLFSAFRPRRRSENRA